MITMDAGHDSPVGSPYIRVTDSPDDEADHRKTEQPTHAPWLFQPFLVSSPKRDSDERKQAGDDEQRNNDRPLPFSIDNILKPGFGQSLFLHSVAAMAAAAAARAAAAAQLQQQLQQLQRPQPRRDWPPSLPCSPVSASEASRELPVDLSSSSSRPSSAGTASPGAAPSADSIKKDDGCPPGMVRGANGQLFPAWVFCTRYSDRPSSGPRMRKIKKPASTDLDKSKDKRPRTAFSSEQLARLKHEFDTNRYLNEERRKNLADELGLNENQIKIWFQNKRAKIKKSTGQKGELAEMLAAQGLYNHSTVPVEDEDDDAYY